MGKEGFEHIMGFHAAPLLTGLRPACLLSFQKSRFEDFEGLLASYLPCFQCKGISVFRLSEGDEFVLLLFYRAGLLEKVMRQRAAQEILLEMGYREGESLTDMLEYLRSRMQVRKSFPHEVGLFLGYPPADVRGFIEHRGQGFACAGYWKKVPSSPSLLRRKGNSPAFPWPSSVPTAGAAVPGWSPGPSAPKMMGLSS